MTSVLHTRCRRVAARMLCVLVLAAVLLTAGAAADSGIVTPEETGALGSPVEIRAGAFGSMPTGGEYMIIGGDKRNGFREQYLDILKVTGGSTTVNTRLLGTDVSSSRAYGNGVVSYAHSIGADAGPSERKGTPFEGISFKTKGVSSLSDLRERVNVDERHAPLQQGRYQLVAGGDGRIHIHNEDPDFVDADGVSSLILIPGYDIGKINTYILPPGKANENSNINSLLSSATKSDTVAIGERILIEVPVYGIWGTTLPRPGSSFTNNRISTLIERHEGVNIAFDTTQFGGPNTPGGTLQFENTPTSQLNPILDRSADLWGSIPGDGRKIGGYYLVVNTRGTAPFDSKPGHNDVLKFRMSIESPRSGAYRFKDYDIAAGEQPDPFDPKQKTGAGGREHWAYWGEDAKLIKETTKIRFVDPSITWSQQKDDGDLLIPSSGNAKIEGSTTMIPGTKMVIRLLSHDDGYGEATVFKSTEVTVDSDRTFSTSLDTSSLSTGQRVEVEFSTTDRLVKNQIIDRRFAYVVGNPDDPHRFTIDSFSGNLELTQRASLGDVAARITNVGDLNDRQDIKFSINGKMVKTETIGLDGGESTRLDLSGEFVTLSPGTYSYTVETEDDTKTGQLTVTDPDSETNITNAESQAATTSSSGADNAGSGESTDGNSDDTESTGLFGLIGVRTQDIAVATAIAGVTHVLGYWA